MALRSPQRTTSPQRSSSARPSDPSFCTWRTPRVASCAARPWVSLSLLPTFLSLGSQVSPSLWTRPVNRLLKPVLLSVGILNRPPRSAPCGQRIVSCNHGKSGPWTAPVN
jgi:hypothetical protein